MKAKIHPGHRHRHRRACQLGVTLYLLVNNFQFSRGISVRVHFTNMGDLNTGAWGTRKAGIKVGSVTALTAPRRKMRKP